MRAALSAEAAGAVAPEVAASARADAAETGGGPAQPDVSSWFADPEGGGANGNLFQGCEHFFLDVFLELPVQIVPLQS